MSHTQRADSNIHTNNNNTNARRSISRSVTAIALVLGLLLSLVSAANAAIIKAPGGDSDQGQPFPDDGIVFGEAPARNEIYLPVRDTVLSKIRDRSSVQTEILAEFDVGGGMIRFLDEGDSVSTVIVGGPKTYRAVAEATNLGELFEAVAPARTVMPTPVAQHSHVPVDILGELDHSRGPQFDNSMVVEDDDWADGCDDEEYDAWKNGFAGYVGGGALEFNVSKHFQTDDATAPNLYGYFGTLDEIWLGVCMVDGLMTRVEMEKRTYNVIYGGEDGYVGDWDGIDNTEAYIYPGERYLYHNHTHYGPLRRANIEPFGSAQYTGWEYYISGAAADSFEPDDQLTNG